MSAGPVNLREALASFSDLYSPRIVARINDYHVKVIHARGEHVWHVHDETDELFLVLEGEFAVSWREAGGEEHRIELQEGDVYVVPKGVEHRPDSGGACVLMFEPAGTFSTGDRHEGPIPDHVDPTAGHRLA